MNLPIDDEKCEACLKGKATRLPFIKCSLPRTRHIGELLHTDLCGPLNPETKAKEKYFQTITDDFSHFTQVYLLKNKNEATRNITNYINRLECQFNTRVYRIRCDNGKEFNNNELKNYCMKKGIKIEFTIPYTSQQNGVSERMNHTLLDKARTMYVETDLPKYLWGEAIRTAALLLNRSPTFALNGGIPAVKWYGHNDLQKIRTFGCKAYAYVLPIPDKLSSRAIETRLVGYCDNGYRLWDIKDDKIITSRDVKFDERPLRAQVKEDQNKVIFHIEEEQSKLQDKSIRELEKDKKTR